ncbi:MAG TPA: PGPGW domain-containing protein [Verrucomicrobiae bacterium]|nr:PGPGW domain-containing protein [Verrucomicrobiae bacterium]
MKKIFIAVIGGAVLLAGIALLVLPGPGTVVIAAGVAILATEFLWARRAWRKAKGTVAKVRRKSGFRSWWQRFKARRAQTSGTPPKDHTDPTSGCDHGAR